MTAVSLIAIATATATLGQTSSVSYVGTWATGIDYPARLAPAPGGGVYVTDPPMKNVVYYNGSGTVVATYAVAEKPIGIAVHSDGRVFISRANGTIGVYSSAFVFQSAVNPAPTTFSSPNDLAFDSVAAELYAVDSGSAKIMVFRETAPNVWTLNRTWGMVGTGMGNFETPQAIALDTVNGLVLVTDADNFRVQVFDTAGILQFKFGYRILFTTSSETAWFARGEGIAVDDCGHIYIADALMGTVRAFSDTGAELSSTHTPLVGYGTGTGQLRVPGDVAIDAAGTMFIANTNNGAVEVFDVTCTSGGLSSVGAPTVRDDELMAKHHRMVSERFGTVGRRHAVPLAPDNPEDIVAAMVGGEYRSELDLNQNEFVDQGDLDIAVAAFGMGTTADFLSGEGGVAAHPSLNPPHIIDIPNRCGRCHDMDNAPGGMLSAGGQENLCESCHSAGKIAGKMPVAAGDTSMSHPWGIVPADLDPASDLALHLDAGKMRCGTCHDPHESFQGICEGENISGSTPVTGICVDGPFDAKPCWKDEQCKLSFVRTEGEPSRLCAECHEEYDQWLHAGHSDEHADPFSHYNWTQSSRSACRMCHSGNGYIDFSNGVPESQRRGTMRVLDCLVCHATHGKAQANELLRIYDTVTLPGQPTITDAGSSATCMTCHNGRTTPPVTGPGITTPHYLSGGVMLEGVNGVTWGNTSIQSSDHKNLLKCADCHMAPTPTSGPGAGTVGAHTFNLRDHDSGFENAPNACGRCHTGLTTINRTARGDYDGDGATEGVQDETSGLLAVVEGAIVAKGALHLPGYPYWQIGVCVGGTRNGQACTPNQSTDSCVTSGGVCNSFLTPSDLATQLILEDAIWNWEFVDNSGDLGVKNTAYAVGLLQLSYEKLTGTVLNAYLRYVPTGQTASLQYVGSDTCLTCHGTMAVTGEDYSSFIRSGHPYKLNEVVNGQMPTFPFSSIAGALGLVTDNDALPGDPKPGTDNTLGTPFSYADISYVIGGFAWKARWIDLAGYVITGTATQYNLATGGMAAYNDNQVDKKYDCGACHTTGWKDYTSATGDTRNLNRQKNLPGMAGTWYDEGVQCEACHGGGSFHAAAPTAANITKIATPRTTADLTAADMGYGKPIACKECHTRDGEKLYPTYVPAGNRIKASGGFIQHHEQYDEMVGVNPDNVPAGQKGPHANLLCTACHNPHTTTVYMNVSGDPPGMEKACAVCHNQIGIGGKEYNLTGDMAGVGCAECHMPYLVKSAVSYPAVGTGPSEADIRAHIFQIDLTTTTQFTGTGAYSYPWITGQYACNHCHNGVDRFGLSFPDLSTTIHGGFPPGPDARRGGLLYDKWWVVNGAPTPTGKHPLYPSIGTKTGNTTYRCKECHGWDYIGKDGRYESGGNYTGIKGVLDAVTTMTEAEIFAIIKNPNGDGTGGTTVNGHNFAAYGLSDGDVNDLVAFIKNGGVIDPSPYINRAGSPGGYTYSFNGNAVAGESLYSGGVNPAVDCSMCHGPDGTAIVFGGVDVVGSLANDNPQETFHKIRFGHAGARMTSYYELGMTDAQGADVGAYCATLPQ